MLNPGAKLGPYEILAPLGAGGMGEVYRARDTRLDRTVAIKILPEAFAADASRLQRFEQEAKLLSALSHPNLLSIFDIGEYQGAHYFVAELLEGETLRQKMTESALPLRKAVEYGIQIAHGLAAAHAKGIVHRDLKPENVFVSADGRVKILDFGLAKSALLPGAEATAATMASEPGMVLGTVGYMSPEQARGKPADQRSDIFSFGTLLYEMLAHQRAFSGDSAVEVMNAILKEDPPELPPGERVVPAALERIVRRCLEKSPDERFQSARDLAFALEAVAAPSSASGSRPALASVVNQRSRWITAAALAGVLALAAIAFLAGRRLAISRPPQYTQLTFDTGYAGPARFTRDGSAVVYSAAWNGNPVQLFWQRASSSQARPLNQDADVMGIADNGDMAVILKHHYRASWLASGTLARLPVEGGTPRPMLDEV